MLTLNRILSVPVSQRHRFFHKLTSVQTLTIPKLYNQSLQFERHSFSTYRPETPNSLFPRLDYTSNKDIARSNSMITRLCEEGRISEARILFDELPQPDAISWTTMISGYIKCGMIEQARELFDRVRATKNVVMWTIMISGYIRSNRMCEAERLFNEMPEKNVVSLNTMIDGYIKNGDIDKGLALFERLEERNVVSWNIVVGGLAQCGRIEEAQKFFDRMPWRNVVSWTAMITGLSRNGRVDEARVLFERMPERNVVSWNAMVNGYLQNSRLDDALDLFEKMPEKNVKSWNTIITGHIQNGYLLKARTLFEEMPRKNVVSWTTMINGYVQGGESEEALRLFLDMHKDGLVKANDATFVSILSACSDLAGLCEGMQIHQVVSKTLYQENEFVISALINMYSKCGDLLTARKLFDDGSSGKRDLVSWNGMITAYAYHGCGGEAIKLFKEMQSMGFKPNDVTYVGVLAACSHAGLVDDGLKYFDELTRDHSIKLREDHYTCLVDLYSRAGRLKEAFELIECLPAKTSSFTWGAFLAGCSNHGNRDVMKLAAEKLSEMEPESYGSYLSLSSIDASNQNWEKVGKTRTEMREKGLRKQPGCSWIEIKNRFHVFVVGDKSHDDYDIIDSLLCDLHTKMRKDGLLLTDNLDVL